ncbi:hypothetical protein J2X55_002273 [Microbacterium sp. 1154]|uniref:hypothetical protein n=1 Tax=Microbacterium sp. 1154 TaxID=2817733 RepID=UPI00285EEE40|nr:hypothetical protein [Microbacterium sp. 1154]MDR6691361.1 hypothetical protein [Microbacterium sp. 1154]
MINPSDWAHLAAAPHDAIPLAVWLWLKLDPMGRGPFDVDWIAHDLYPPETPDWEAAKDEVLGHVLALMDAGFLSTYKADGREWLLLLHPLRVDMRGVTIRTPEPESPWTSVAMGRGGARERARERVRAENGARAAAWDAVQAGREETPERPTRPLRMDAPPRYCSKHMPHGPGQKKCGPCRDTRLDQDEWLESRVYEQKLADYYEQTDDWEGRADGPGDEPW